MVPVHTPPEVGPALHQEAALAGHRLAVSSKKTKPWQVGEITNCSDIDLGLPGKVPDSTFLPLPRASSKASLQGAEQADLPASASAGGVGRRRRRWIT